MPKPSDPFARYIKADATIKPRIIAASFGEIGSGKTSFWLGAPGPIVIQTLDQGLEGVVEPYTKEKDIYIANYDLAIEPGAEYTHQCAVEARDKFVEDFEHAIGVARTIVWDRESDMFPLFSFAEFGTDDPFGAATPKDWDKLKGKIRRLIAMAKAADVNFGIIQGMRNEWKSSVNPNTGKKTGISTGNRITSGMEEIDALVHITIEHVYEKGQFGLNIGKSRGPGGREIQGQSFFNLTFVEFAQLVFPDSSEEDWI